MYQSLSLTKIKLLSSTVSICWLFAIPRLGIYEQKLRFFTSEGELVPTPEEAAIAQQQRAQQEQQRADQAETLLARYPRTLW